MTHQTWKFRKAIRPLFAGPVTFSDTVVKPLNKIIKRLDKSLSKHKVLFRISEWIIETYELSPPPVWNKMAANSEDEDCWVESKHSLLQIDKLSYSTVVLYVTGPAKIGHVGSQNLTTFQTFVSHNFLLQYSMATQFS